MSLKRLLRQGAEVACLGTSDGHRELRALQKALVEPIGAGSQARVISLDHGQPTGEWPEAVIWSSALEWLLQA